MKKKLIINPQKKGGVFKSGLTLLLADYLIQNKTNLKVFDIDNRNATTARFKSLNATFIDTKQSNDILDSIFDAFDSNDIVIVDVGAGTAENILEWIKEVDLITVLNDNNIELNVLIPITMVKDSVAGLKDILTILGNSPKYIVILNEYLGNDFSIFLNSKTKQSLDETNHILLTLPKLNDKMLAYMDKNNFTLSDALDSKLPILDKQRLTTIKKTIHPIFDQFNLFS